MARNLKRGHIFALLAAIGIIYLIFFAGSDATDFRKTTEAGLSRGRGALRGDLSDADLTAKTNRELQDILDNQKEQRRLGTNLEADGPENARQPVTQDVAQDGDSEIPVAGRMSMPKPKDKPKYPVDATVSDEAAEEVANIGKVEKAKDDGEDLARHELQRIFKKSPIIIFSKSYCPYSKRAKSLLLQTYSITPAPYVVELDLMTEPVPKPASHGEEDDGPAPTLGRKVQDLLAALTGRRTVPNIMINSQTLGGSDDAFQMDHDGTLTEKIKEMGGKRIVNVQKKKDVAKD